MIEENMVYTDFADELITTNIKNNEFEHVETKNNHICCNYIKIKADRNGFCKEKGDYVSIECDSLFDHQTRKDMIEAIHDNLIIMTNHMRIKLKKILVVGLGNQFIISDALGPKVIDEILITAHYYKNHKQSELKGTRNVAALAPGVMGQTGLETIQIVKSVVATYKPDLMIVVDALATKNISRINKVVQINNTGIQPGSGIGNFRETFNEKKLHVPVIAVGVATVTSVGAILQECLKDRAILKAEIENVYKDENTRLMVTPKSMDEELKHLIYIMSEGINLFLHPDYLNL